MLGPSTKNIPGELILDIKKQTPEQLVSHYKRQIESLELLMGQHLTNDEGHSAQFCQDQITAIEETINSVLFRGLKGALD